MMRFQYSLYCALLFFFISAHGALAENGPVKVIDSKERCRVCGMFVAKYPTWVTQLRLTDDQVLMFDGVKDMLAYYFEADKFGGSKGTQVKEIWVKDYYSQGWIDGQKSIYVTGSNVTGPMGHELIPFSSKEAAEAFFKDHHGKLILPFDQITLETVNSLRSTHQMKQ